jgi:FkbM family methyltransferase
VAYSQRREPMEHQERWYLDHLPLKDQRIVDVGANVGRLSQFFWDHSERTSTLVSVEPMKENVDAIEERIRAAGAAALWTVQMCAISSQDGDVAMRPLKAHWGLNAMVPIGAGAGETVTVPCRRLEALAPDATVVKVDVEGHEFAFLPQSVPVMKDVRAWALELHHVEGHPLEETLRLLADHGFRLITAGAKRTDPQGPWVDVDVTPEWSWDSIGGTPSVRDGLPSTFKMMHLLALR